MKKKIINLTPHGVKVKFSNPFGEYVYLSEGVARVATEEVFVGYLMAPEGEIPLYRTEFHSVEGLPEESEGTFYIVSLAVRTALPERKDLISPTKLIRDEAGRVVGAEAFSINE